MDYTEEKVGLLTRPLAASDFYATSTDERHEPYSSLKVGLMHVSMCNMTSSISRIRAHRCHC